MNGIDQLTLHAPAGSAGDFYRVSSSFREDEQAARWLGLLKPWLRIGRPLGRCHLNFGSRAASIRWYAETSSTQDWEYAIIFAGAANLLTARYVLELPDLGRREVHAGDEPHLPSMPVHGPGRDAIEARARSGDAVALLIPLLAHALQNERSLTMPWTEAGVPEAAVWGLVSILRMIGDSRPVSFLTYATASPNDKLPGLFVSFRPGVPVLPPTPRYDALAGRLATSFARDPAALGVMLAESGLLELASDTARIARLLELWRGTGTGYADAGGTRTMTEQSHQPRHAAPTLPPTTTPGKAAKNVVMCPICLHKIHDWNSLDRYKWDPRRQEYVRNPAPPDLNDVQLARYLQSAYVRCPNSADDDVGTAHYLPVSYGHFGNPVMLGFVGLTRSGKTHLMAAMIGAIENGGLEEYGITSRPLDHASHLRFLQEQVEPLLNQDRQLPGTQENLRMFADAFLMSADGGPERPIILFDVAGGDLTKVGEESKEFLWIADGLFFVIDPDFVSIQRAGDATFANVLSVVHESSRSRLVSAAIVLSKADKVRFEEPVARWLRTEGSALDPAEFLRESADVYAYLRAKDAGALTRPYQVCDRATLHVASPTGGPSEGEPDHGLFPRGVTPRRVLRPLVAMLAMTGVLTGSEAEKVGM